MQFNIGIEHINLHSEEMTSCRVMEYRKKKNYHLLQCAIYSSVSQITLAMKQLETCDFQF